MESIKLTADTKELKENLDDIEEQLKRIKLLCGEIKDADLIVSKLKLEEGDTVVFQIKEILNDHSYEMLKNSLHRVIGEKNKVLILEDGMSIETILKAE
jgi:hypothetical protein